MRRISFNYPLAAIASILLTPTFVVAATNVVSKTSSMSAPSSLAYPPHKVKLRLAKDLPKGGLAAIVSFAADADGGVVIDLKEGSLSLGVLQLALAAYDRLADAKSVYPQANVSAEIPENASAGKIEPATEARLAQIIKDLKARGVGHVLEVQAP